VRSGSARGFCGGWRRVAADRPSPVAFRDILSRKRET
jgi:hypothetical protein